MPHVRFTQNLQRHVETPEVDVHGVTVRETLDAVFETHPGLRGYVFDDQGRLRKHMVLFIDGEMVEDRSGLTDPIDHDSELFVMQALSGG